MAVLTIKRLLPGLLILLLWGCEPSPPSADIILTNARVYTMDWPDPGSDGVPHPESPYRVTGWQPDADSLAIKDGKILAVGRAEEILAHQTDDTQLIDVKKATVIPGLIDSHVHIAELGEILSHVNLIGVKTPAEAVKRLQEYAKSMKPGQWIIGQGWDEGAWANQYPTREILDEAFPENPVYLKSLHGFAVWLNSQALNSIGVSQQTPDPTGGTIVRDKSGEATGILLNRATALAAENIPQADFDTFRSYIRKGMLQMASDGYVAIHQAGATAQHIKAFESLKQRKQLPLRTYAMLSARDPVLGEEWIKKGPLSDPEGWLDVRSVKAYYDGALGSRGARLLEDYSDMPGHRGVSGDGYGFDASLVENLMAKGFQVGIHAIGDAGNRETLDFIEGVYTRQPQSQNNRHRIEHAQVIADEDFKRFKQLGLIASMEPPHAVEDKDWAEQRLGAERIKGAYAWRRLIMAGAGLTLNSDLPGSDHNIFYGLHAAVTRRDKQLLPAGGWNAQENLTMEEAIRGYTTWAAKAAFRENASGKISVGYWADVTVLNMDPFVVHELDPDQLLRGKVLMTIIDGKIAFRAK